MRAKTTTTDRELTNTKKNIVEDIAINFRINTASLENHSFFDQLVLGFEEDQEESQKSTKQLGEQGAGIFVLDGKITGIIISDFSKLNINPDNFKTRQKDLLLLVCNEREGFIESLFKLISMHESRKVSLRAVQ